MIIQWSIVKWKRKELRVSWWKLLEKKAVDKLVISYSLLPPGRKCSVTTAILGGDVVTFSELRSIF